MTVEDGNEILGIAPLMSSKYRLPGFGSIRKIEFLATRHSDYNNFIIRKKEAACTRAIFNYLEMMKTDWDLIELRDIPEYSGEHSLMQILAQDPPSSLNLKKRVSELCPYAALPTRFDIFVKGLSTKVQKNLNRRLRKIKREYCVKLKRYDEAGFTAKQGIAVFTRLNGARWSSEGLPGAFGYVDDNFRKFHADIAERFANNGWLGLYFLTANDEPVSAEYSFEYNRKIYAYLSGFDPNYSNYSVGNLVVMLLLERAIKNGFVEYDMMRGDEAYKFMWTNTYRRNIEMRLARRKIVSEYYNILSWNKIVFGLGRKLGLSLKKLN